MNLSRASLLYAISIICIAGCSGGATNTQPPSSTQSPSSPSQPENSDRTITLSDSCPNLSGVYRSTDKEIVPRTLTIQQESCLDYKVTLKNGDDDTPSTDVYKADSRPYNSRGAYDEASNSYPKDGSAASDSSSMFDRIRRTDSALVVRHVWVFHHGFKTSGCVEEVKQQNACVVSEIRYDHSGNDTLLETQTGNTYSYGQMIPSYIHYSKIK